MSTRRIISRATVYNYSLDDLGDDVTVIVEETTKGKYRVFVEGGSLANGDDDFKTPDLRAALREAADQAQAWATSEL